MPVPTTNNMPIIDRHNTTETHNRQFVSDLVDGDYDCINIPYNTDTLLKLLDITVRHQQFGEFMADIRSNVQRFNICDIRIYYDNTDTYSFRACITCEYFQTDGSYVTAQSLDIPIMPADWSLFLQYLNASGIQFTE